MSTTHDEAVYLKARESEERDAAERSSCMVKDVHLDLADHYAARAERAEREAG